MSALIAEFFYQGGAVILWIAVLWVGAAYVVTRTLRD